MRNSQLMQKRFELLSHKVSKYESNVQGFKQTTVWILVCKLFYTLEETQTFLL